MPAAKRDPSGWGSKILCAIRDLHLVTDEGIVARCRELGISVDDSTISRWRTGDRPAPLWLLGILLGYADDPAAILGLIARPFGLRVVPEARSCPSGPDLALGVLDVVERVGELATALRIARADGVITPAEADELHRQVESLEQQAAGLRAAIAPLRDAMGGGR